MKEYDIVIVGAGPGGSFAAKTAAEKGASVIIIEEHPQIGIPRHCTGLLMSSNFNSEIRRMVGEHVFLQSRRLVRVYAPSGKMLREISIGEGGCCITNRSELDKELAKLAVNAGAHIMLNTKVTGLMKHDGKVVGVATNSKTDTEIKGKCVIVAGGLTAFTTGIPKQEGMIGPNEKFHAGLMLEIANVKGIEPDVIEWWYCKFPSTTGCFFFEPLDSRSSIVDVQSLEEFERIKTAGYPFSFKIKDAFPVRMWGTGPSRINTGLPLAKTYKDGMIVIGGAAGFNGIQPAMLTGKFAAEVACQAIHANDVSESKLKRFEDMWKALGIGHIYDYWRSLRQDLSSMQDMETLEEDLERRVKHGEDLITCFSEPY